MKIIINILVFWVILGCIVSMGIYMKNNKNPKFEEYGIIITDTTIHVINEFKAGGEAKKYKHRYSITKGKQMYYQLNSKTGLYIIIK